MKHIVFLVVALAAMPAFAQAQKPEAIKAEPIKAAEPAKPKAAKPAKHTNRRSEDARQCLERATNSDIIKCAEEYL